MLSWASWPLLYPTPIIPLYPLTKELKECYSNFFLSKSIVPKITIRFFRMRFLSSHSIPCKIYGSSKRNFGHHMAPLAKYPYHMLSKQQQLRLMKSRNTRKMERLIPQGDGKCYPYPQWEPLYIELYKPSATANANVSTPTYYASIHPSLYTPKFNQTNMNIHDEIPPPTHT